jgi:hypothetical protein
LEFKAADTVSKIVSRSFVQDSPLALRTPERRASVLREPPHDAAAAGAFAFLALAVIDLKRVLEITELAGGLAVIAERRAASLDRLIEHSLKRIKPAPLVRGSRWDAGRRSTAVRPTFAAIPACKKRPAGSGFGSILRLLRGQQEWLRAGSVNRKHIASTTIIFIHGVLSNTVDCWLHPEGGYWPKLIA